MLRITGNGENNSMTAIYCIIFHPHFSDGVQDLSCAALVQDKSCIPFERWFNDCCQFIDSDIDNAVFTDIMKDAITLAKRLAQSHYRSEDHRAFGHFIEIHDVGRRQQVHNMPEVSMKCLDKACRRENDAHLITWGL
jgi:hypothetical protein